MSQKEVLINRPHYISQFNLWKNKKDIVKIVTGVRRLFNQYIVL